MEISKLSAYTQRILGGGEITPEEALELLTVNDEDTPLLAAFADKIRQHFCGNDVDCCAIAAARSGKCSDTIGIEICCSLGLINKTQLKALKAAGITRYHSNIETAPSYFPSICTTHTFADKERMVKEVIAAGLRPCCGGIFGLGESQHQRIEMAYTLKRLGIDSVPVNILNPIKGTALENVQPPSPWEILRIFSVLRFILPKAQMDRQMLQDLNRRPAIPCLS